MVSISPSLIAGMIGATITVTGTPALASSSMACRRRSGALARGSRRRASPASSVVIEIATLTSPFAAIGASRSRSRSTSADLVTMPTGWLVRARTSRICRVTRSVRSTGW